MSDRIDHGERDKYPDERRKHAHPLFWLLVLAALLALAWSLYTRLAGEATPAMVNPELTPTAAPAPKDTANHPPAPAPRR